MNKIIIGCKEIIGRILGGFIICGLIYNGKMVLCKECRVLQKGVKK